VPKRPAVEMAGFALPTHSMPAVEMADFGNRRVTEKSLLQSRKLHLGRTGVARDYFPAIIEFLQVHRSVTDDFVSGTRKGN
jgi:hypothetical protein